MNEKTPQDAAAEDAVVARVRAADPAAGTAPDTVGLRGVVDERRASAEAGPGAPDELAARRARRWTGWPARIAGVAAVALVVGGGSGYAIGSAGGPADHAAAAAVISLDGPNGAGPESAPMADEAGSSLPRVSSTAEQWGMTADMAYWPGMYGRTVFTAAGLSETGTSLHAWALDASRSFTEQTIAAAAAALGVPGTPRLVDGSWIVGSTDGTGATVQLYADGTGSLSYWDPAMDVWYCPSDGGRDESASEGEADPQVAIPEPTVMPTAVPEPAMPEPDPCVERDLGPAPQGDAAIGQVRDILTALGLDPAGFELVVEDYGDQSQQWTYVTAYQVLDGQRTGLSWSATLTGVGVQSLYGSTAPLVDLGEYQVVSPAEAVRRLSDPRFGGSWSGPILMDTPGMARDDVAVDQAEAAPVEPTVPPTATPGSRISWPVDQVTIVDSRLGLATHYQLDGSTLLVPTYELISDGGAVWTVIAVEDVHLDFSTGR